MASVFRCNMSSIYGLTVAAIYYSINNSHVQVTSCQLFWARNREAGAGVKVHVPCIGGCRAQNEPRHGIVSIYETFILCRLFKPHFCHKQQSLPGQSPGMPWPAATYGTMDGARNILEFPYCSPNYNVAVCNHWTGLVDWTTGLDYWTDFWP